MARKRSVSPTHWTEDLFPPTFTSEDILSLSPIQKNTNNCHGKQDLFLKIYSEVILEDAHKKKNKSVVQMKGNFENGPIPKYCNESLSDVDTVWNQKDLITFRKAYQELKEKTVKLLCILETRNNKIDELKVANKLLQKDLGSKETEISELIKNNESLKAYGNSCCEISDNLEQKLQFYVHCNNDLVDSVKKLQIQNNRLDENLRKCKQSKQKVSHLLKETEIKCKNDLNNQERNLRLDYESIIKNLEFAIKKYCSEIETTNKLCKIQAKSLEILQRHYNKNIAKNNHETLNNKFQKVQEITTERFLNVVDI